MRERRTERGCGLPRLQLDGAPVSDRPIVPGKTAIATGIIYDGRVSWDARGALLYVLSYPPNHFSSMAPVRKNGCVGQYQWARIRDELIKFGYIVVDDGCGEAVGYWFTDEPFVISKASRWVPARKGGKRDIPLALRWQIWERDDFRCQRCGSRQFLTIDHKHPESRGGSLDPVNLQTLCKPCNSRKGAST